MNKYINEKGLTLVELLAVIALISVISIFLFNIIVKSIENSENIILETQLRDEADIIVSKFIKEIYSIHYEEIIYNTTDNNGSYLLISKDHSKCLKNDLGQVENTALCEPTLYAVGIKKAASMDYVFIFNDKIYKPNYNIKIDAASKISGEPNKTSMYELDLVLKMTKKTNKKTIEKTMQFNNKVNTITK